METKTVYVGWTSRAVRNHLLAKPTAPSNYKDPEKIAEFVAKAGEKLLRDSSTLPGVAEIEQVCIGVKGRHQAEHFDVLADRATTLSRIAAQILPYGVCTCLVGLGIREFLRCLAVDALMSAAELPPGFVELAFRQRPAVATDEYSRRYPIAVIDPFAALLPSAIEGKVDDLQYVQAVLMDNSFKWPKNAYESMRVSQLLAERTGLSQTLDNMLTGRAED